VHIPEETIIRAVRASDLVQLRRWMRLGVRVSSSGFPLCHAVSLGNIDVVSLLVEGLGADVNKTVPTNSESATPLTLAVMKGNVTMARCLVKTLGADVNQATQEGTPPLLWAAMNGDVAMVCCLVKELGADVNQTCKDCVTPSHCAAQEGNLVMMRTLKELGVDVNRATLDGRSPLLIAAAKGYANVVKILAEEFGADINQASHDGVTPLMVASSGKHDKVIRWLTKNGADTASSSHFGTAAEISRIYGAPAEQTAYLEAKAHCSNPGCDGTGLRKCQGCKQVRYCGVECGLAHWSLHKSECKRIDKA
jgi:ankyrin repeat protein